MSRRRLQGAATIVLVVCLGASGHGWMNMNGETDPLHIGRGSIAAGRAHSVIAMPDGHVMTWGAGARGQLGDGALMNRTTPAPVAGLDDVIAVTAGAAHTVALTSHGEVYAWGANAFGRLGDGTRMRRTRPVRVRGLSAVTAIAAGRAHTLALTARGTVFAWGRNVEGQLGDGTRVTVTVPSEVRGLANIVAIAAGDTHSFAVTRDGRLYGWGSNDFSKLGDGTAKDRLKPVAIGITDVASIAAGASHTVALRRNGDVYSWGQGAHGALGTGTTSAASTPKLISGLKATAVSAGRHFSAAIRADGTVVAWGANDSGQLGDGSRVRRLRPVVVAGLTAIQALALGDAHAMAVTTSGDLRTWGEGDQGRLGSGSLADRTIAMDAISDIQDWGELPGESEPLDTVPPSIVAATSPPLQNGWMMTPVTVTFQCADNIGIQSCPGPITIASDVAAQQIVGTAVDLAGNRATASVVVSVDMHPPVLSIAEPQDQSITPASAITLSGLAFDRGSGVSNIGCNGTTAQVVGDVMSCSVALKPGRNEVIVHAVDAVGHNTSASVTVTRITASTSLALTPATRTLEVNEIATLSLRDDSGVRVENASWTSDSEILTLSDDDPPRITARTLGTATITAEKDGLEAHATVVVSPGLSTGDTRWSLPMNLAFPLDFPLFANRVAPDVPSLFTSERTGAIESIVRAIGVEGDVVWQQQVSGVPLMGDSFGGLVVGIMDSQQNYRAYSRLGGGTTRSWRYDSTGRLGRPAQAYDGTIYGIERLLAGTNQNGEDVWEKYAILVDGATGALLSRTQLTREISNFYSDHDGEIIETEWPSHCLTTMFANPPETLDPVAGSDGRGYLVVRRFRQIKRGACSEPYDRRPQRTIEMGLDLVILSRNAPPETIDLYTQSCTGALGTTYSCDYPVHAVQVMPDGIGGTLITWERGGPAEGDYVPGQRWLTRVSADGKVDRLVAPEFSLEIIGQNGIAIAADDGWKAFDVESGNLKWANPRELWPIAARPDGGAASVASDGVNLAITNGDGGSEASLPSSHWWAVHDNGQWIGFRDSDLSAVVADFDDATRFSVSGTKTGQQSVRMPGIGIWLKTHNATVSLVPFQHVSIRVTPLNQNWLLQNAGLFETCAPPDQCSLGTDVFGNRFFTMGAGAGTDDTNLQCNGLLTKGFNREADVLKAPAQPLKELPHDPALQAILVNSLIQSFNGYLNNLSYHCFPEERPGFYNSNSFSHGLLHSAGVTHAETPPTLKPVPGWFTPVPAVFFAR